ncbi:hypothetical protein WA158_001262 [Blastocystis sp. Blastoise]
MISSVSDYAGRLNLKRFVKKNRANVLLWTSFIVFIMFAFHFFSDGDFSFLLTLGSMVCCFGFILILIKVITSQSVMGLSLKSLQCYAVVFLTRTIAITRSEGYLPFDRSGDWLYQTIECLTLLVILVVIYCIMVQFRYTHNAHQDTFGNNYVSQKLGALLLIVPCLILGFLFHPALAHSYFLDSCWSVSQLLESVAIIPQLTMFTKNRSGEVEPFTSHFVFAQAASRFLNFLFWSSSWKELNRGANWFSSHLAGQTVVCAQITQMILMANYVYHYINSVINDAPMRLPTYMNVRMD